MVDACAVYVQKAEPTPVTPVKSLGGVAAPATPLTAQKAGAVKAEGGRPVLDALLKKMGINLQVLQNDKRCRWQKSQRARSEYARNRACFESFQK